MPSQLQAGERCSQGRGNIGRETLSFVLADSSYTMDGGLGEAGELFVGWNLGHPTPVDLWMLEEFYFPVHHLSRLFSQLCSGHGSLDGRKIR